jgi:hypothetical protein
MRRRTLLVILALLVVPTPARADFHDTSQACANEPGYAYVSLSYLDAYLWFQGSVYCNGANSVAITSLTITSVVPPGAPFHGGTTSCAPCDGTPISASGLAQDSPGIYRVDMQFTATGPGGTFTPSRSAHYLVTVSPIEPIDPLSLQPY